MWGIILGDFQSIMAHTGDTTINGQAYQVTERTENTGQQKIYTRFSNDTIYRWVNDQEYLFFTYDLEVRPRVYYIPFGRSNGQLGRQLLYFRNAIESNG
ncbi:MAG: hypothetical protein U5L09_15510 [Bacteroidales bacterium]|nr:hypothetical protein [Bacteroidales bacterium]